MPTVIRWNTLLKRRDAVIIQSYGLTGQPEPEIIAAMSAGAECDGFIAFELGNVRAVR